MSTIDKTGVFSDVDRRGRLDRGKLRTFGGLGTVDVLGGWNQVGQRGAVMGRLDGVAMHVWEAIYAWIAWLFLESFRGFVYWLLIHAVHVAVCSSAGNVVELQQFLEGWMGRGLAVADQVGLVLWRRYLYHLGVVNTYVTVPFVVAMWVAYNNDKHVQQYTGTHGHMVERYAIKAFVMGLMLVAGNLASVANSMFSQLLAVVITVVSSIVYSSVILRNAHARYGRGVVVVQLIRFASSIPFGLLGLLVCEHLPVPRVGRSATVTSVASGMDSVIADAVYRNTGLTVHGAFKVLSVEQLQAVGSVNQGAPESATVRQMAYVGDRVMSLALASRAMREQWPVARTDAMSQAVLTNAAFARYVDATLSKAFPRIVGRSEKRKGTLLEALVGMYYTSTLSIEGVEEFVFGRVAPMVPGI